MLNCGAQVGLGNAGFCTSQCYGVIQWQSSRSQCSIAIVLLHCSPHIVAGVPWHQATIQKEREKTRCEAEIWVLAITDVID
jgi:hypothetical protein